MIPADLATGRLLVYGVGNVGRGDDGAGILLAERLEGAGLAGRVTIESNYQLVPEDATLLVDHDAVLFIDADAAAGARAPYDVRRVAPASEVAFSTHTLTMGALLALCLRLYGRVPDAWVLAVPAHDFEVNAPLSSETAAHVDRAFADLRTVLAGHGDAGA
ncbi:MAG: hydrogenase maturation protease [Vicinamibacterales bacterium]